MNTIIEGNTQFNDWYNAFENDYAFMGVANNLAPVDVEVDEHIARSMCVNKRTDHRLNFGE
jgi:hypothetical protein